jgi:hypothetical protein
VAGMRLVVLITRTHIVVQPILCGRVQERQHLQRFLDVDGDDCRDYVLRRLRDLCDDKTMWTFRRRALSLCLCVYYADIGHVCLWFWATAIRWWLTQKIQVDVVALRTPAMRKSCCTASSLRLMTCWNHRIATLTNLRTYSDRLRHCTPLTGRLPADFACWALVTSVRMVLFSWWQSSWNSRHLGPLHRCEGGRSLADRFQAAVSCQAVDEGQMFATANSTPIFVEVYV